MKFTLNPIIVNNTVLISMALEGGGGGARAPGAPLLPPPMQRPSLAHLIYPSLPMTSVASLLIRPRLMSLILHGKGSMKVTGYLHSYKAYLSTKGLSTAEGERGHVTTYMYCV